MKQHSARKLRSSHLFMGYSFTLPVIAFLFFFIFVSIMYCFYMSFFEWKLFDLGADKTFIGISNYLRVFKDEIFGAAFRNTIVIVVSCIVVETVLGFLIALTLWTMKKTLRVLQTVILLPMITSPVIVGLIWRYIYDPQFGILNYLFTHVLGTSDIAWLGDDTTALFSVILVDIWQMTPFTVLVLFAAMMNISEDWIEAAQVDGARYWLIVRKIILPAVAPMTQFVLLMRTMDLLKIFDTVYVLTRGGPGFSTETLAMYTYKVGFSQYEMGYAMVLSIITLLCILAISCVYIRQSRKSET